MTIRLKNRQQIIYTLKKNFGEISSYGSEPANKKQTLNDKDDDKKRDEDDFLFWDMMDDD